MADAKQIAALVKQVGSLSDAKVVGPAWADAAPVFDQLLADDAAAAAVIDLLPPEDKQDDWQARYVVGALAAYVVAKDKAPQRQRLQKAILATLVADRPAAVKRFLLQQLRTFADRSAAGPVGKLLADEQLCDDAAAVLASVGDVEPFRAALATATGRARLVVVQALANAGDAASADALNKLAGDADREVRIAAVAGLANIGRADCCATVGKALAREGWERTCAIRANLLLAEKLTAAGNKADADKLLTRLQSACTDDSETYVRELAAARLSDQSR